MSSKIAKINTGTNIAQASESEVMDVLKNSLYPGAQEGSIKLVQSYCKAAGLDPMQKPVHIVPMYVKDAQTGQGSMRDVVMPGIGLYRIQAARSGEHAGTSEPVFGEEVTERLEGRDFTFPKFCKVTVRRLMPNGQIAEHHATEFWLENYATEKRDSQWPNTMWRKRKYGQLAKCAEAQALRKAFPEFGSSPTVEEMEGKSMYSDEIPSIASSSSERGQPQAYPADQFDKNLPAWKGMIQAGKKSPEDIIKTVESKGSLTEEQKKQIRDAVVIDAEFAEGEEA